MILLLYQTFARFPTANPEKNWTQMCECVDFPLSGLVIPREMRYNMLK